MQNNNEFFSICLAEIMKERDLSINELTKLLNLKSKTTLVRILQKSAGQKSIQSILQLMIQNKDLNLTATEIKKLNDSLSPETQVVFKQSVYEELRKLLFKKDSPDKDIRIINSDKFGSFYDLLQVLPDCDVECIIIGCETLPFASELSRLIHDPTKKNISVSQYFYDIPSKPHKMVQAIGLAAPFLDSKNYMAYTISSKTIDYAIHAVLIRCCNANNCTEYELLFYNENTSILSEGIGIKNKWSAYLEQFEHKTIKTVADVSADNYIAFTNTYRKLEERCNIYKFRPDLCICYIHENIVNAALMDGCRKLEISFPNSTISEVTNIHRKRYNNIFSQKRATQLVVSATAMRKFAETGFQSDHVYLMRPYTVTERIQILSSCINQMNANPYFIIYLLTEEAEKLIYSNNTPFEMVCYEGKCVQLTPAITDYNFNSGHSEVFIDDPLFIRQFTDFFLNDLVANYTQPKKETIKFFKNLVSKLLNQI